MEGKARRGKGREGRGVKAHKRRKRTKGKEEEELKVMGCIVKVVRGREGGRVR